MAALLLQPPPNKPPLKPEAACIPLLERYSTKEDLRQVHAQMVKTGLVLDTLPASRLLAAMSAASDGLPNDALRFFGRINRPNTFMWNTMIRACSNSSNPETAILVYCQMLHNAAPHNPYTFPFLLRACANLSSTSAETSQIHCHIIKTGFAADVYTANSLLHIYAKSGSTLPARRLFDRMAHRDTVTWNSMIDGYAKSGRIEMARGLFDLMRTKNVVTWTTMITGYIESCLFKEALEFFRLMMRSTEIEADGVVLGSALSACAQLGALDQGRWIHTYINKKRIESDAVLGCALVDMYAKCGELDEALAVFMGIQERNVPVWTAMITGFAVHGRGREALDLFSDMEEAGIRPNHVTFTGILTACSYAGMVEEGKSIFQRMVKDYSMSPSIVHYGCMVDLLGRAGLLEAAEDIISTMPMMPNAAVWGALLNACHIHRNFELGRRVGEILIELEPDHGGRYIRLASILSAEGDWYGAAAVRQQMKERGVRKLAGCSSIILDGTVHEFFVGDRSHMLTEEIYLQWNQILRRLKKGGYIPVTEDLLLDLEEEEKETAIHCHSEKLAIALGFIRTEPGTTIQIVKNLRVCMDCHTVAKLISKVYRRRIIMRDRTRFHHFEDGQCSCRDYW